ncbi:unnamed protein product, partial [Sphenostylis stenocarpa]
MLDHPPSVVSVSVSRMSVNKVSGFCGEITVYPFLELTCTISISLVLSTPNSKYGVFPFNINE